MDFDELEQLRIHLERLLQSSEPSMAHFHMEGGPGFAHQANRPAEKGFSKSSTATCVSFLVATGTWNAKSKGEEAQQLIDIVTAENYEWASAGLQADNPFTVAFLVEMLADLKAAGGALTEEQAAVVEDKVDGLRGALTEGGVRITGYPRTAFLTQKVLHALARWEGQLAEPTKEKVVGWGWNQLHQESVLIEVHTPDADVFELAYAILTVLATQPMSDMTPRQREVLQHALDQFLDSQLREGTWPRSRPLFLYPKLGYAYCYDFELLVQMLGEKQLHPWLLERLPKLADAAYGLDRTRYDLDGRAVGWASGHLAGAPKPESWVTASALHYCHLLSGLAAEGIRRNIFDYTRQAAGYVEPDEKRESDYWKGFLDADIDVAEGEGRSLKETLEAGFIKPIRTHQELVLQGRRLPKDVYVSAILYGPPGTAKTELASRIANGLGWPLLSLDPSHLTRSGLDRLHAETDRLFGMLAAAERLVVLFDEFDELVRERELAASEALSRFLTTAMLPKLKALADRRRIVYLLATNHLENFDPAVQRPGRFDAILPVMPPRADEKLSFEQWAPIAELLDQAGMTPENDTEVWRKFGDFTFHEFEQLARRVAPLAAEGGPNTRGRITEMVNDEHARCQLSQQVVGADPQTWAGHMEAQRLRIRLPRAE